MPNIQRAGVDMEDDRSARRAALAPFTSDKWDGGKSVDAWFDAIKEEREARARLRQEARSVDRLRGLVRNGNFDADALKMVEKVERIRERDPVRAVRLHTQYMVLAQMRGVDQDCEIIDPEDRKPAPFDRTPAGRRLKTYRPAQENTNPSFGSVVRRIDELEFRKAYETCLARLRDGANPKDLGKGKGPGRNSNAWNRGLMEAIETFALESSAETADEPTAEPTEE